MDNSIANVEQRLVGLKKAAMALDVSVWTVIKWVQKGKISSVKLARRRMVSVAELDRIVREGIR